MMTGVQFEEIWKALYTGYTKSTLSQLLRTRIGTELDDIVGDGPMKDMTFDLLGAAEREGWEVDLVREAYRFNPRNADLLRIYEKYGLAPRLGLQLAGAAQPAPTSSIDAGFEATIRQRIPMLDFNVFRERSARVESQVCRIDLHGQPKGTGFLVGPDAVLTNYHVLDSVVNGVHPPQSVECRFDYKMLADHTREEGVRIRLAPQWNIDSSSYTAAESNGQPEGALPTADELDYTLVRLERPIGREPASKGGGAAAPIRGWVTVPNDPVAPPFTPKDPLLIAQHPRGDPLKLAIDTEAILGVNANGTRVRYATNTEGGSSGSPCFSMEWKLLALHHYGDPAYNHPKWNQGIPIEKIRARLKRVGAEGSLGDNAP